jgi:aminomethyltransferase
VLQSKGGAVDMTVHDDRALLALQGPAAAETLQPLVKIDLGKVYFSDFNKLDIAGIPCYMTRTGCAPSHQCLLDIVCLSRSWQDVRP